MDAERRRVIDGLARAYDTVKPEPGMDGPHGGPTPSIERLANVVHRARCGPDVWVGGERVEWSREHREWDREMAHAMWMLGVDPPALSDEPDVAREANP